MTESEFIPLVAKTLGWQNVQVERRSEKPFDVGIQGFDTRLNCQFSAWLPLASIKAFTPWTSERIAIHSNYPDMCMEGDWSGMRDSDDENIWFIFNNFVVKKMRNETV